MTPDIHVDALSITFGPRSAPHKVLDLVSFDVAPGEVFGLVGESGSGKSTVLRCISGLYRHWTGDIAVGGQPMGRTITKQGCRLVQTVFQDPYGSLHPKMTVNSQLMEPIRIHRLDAGKVRIARVLDQVGLLPYHRYRYPHQLSGGQRQRVAIARALLLEPKILLLDEPTSALDVSVQAEILNLLVDLREHAGLTYILVSHDLAVISYMCNRFAVMRQGRIIETLDRTALDGTSTRVSDYTKLLIEASRRYDRGLAARAAQQF